MTTPIAQGPVDVIISPADARRVFELLGSIFYYGNFKAETPNEIELQALMEKNGYFFATEDQLLIRLYGANVEVSRIRRLT